MTNSNKQLSYGLIRRTVIKIIEEEGLKGMFSGVSMRFLYISIGGMIFFGMNEKMKKLLKFEVS